MTTGFLWFKRVAFIISALFVGFAFGYAAYLNDVEEGGTETAFYFLVSESTHTQASTQTVQLNGGAGYVLFHNGNDLVAYSSYAREGDCLAAQSDVEDAQVLKLSCEKLYFKGKDKAKAKQIVGAMHSLYGCIQVLEQEIARLDKGATQESSKRVLRTLKAQLSYLSKENDKVFPEYAKLCKHASETIDSFCTDIVYASKLRYLHCLLCDGHIRLCGRYSL